MKTMRKKWLLPLLAIAIAVGGAFASSSTIDNTLSTTGYLSLQMPCDTPVQCGTSGIPGCTVPEGTAYGKIHPNDNVCQVPLFRP
ncbi:DUF6520 family protein [Ulvibacter litoralis]|uniref:Secreted protein n=1 Tax=Ulvibacter litoralis TaxID=227084 RepID=A0A1G7JF16_9FLAO|nr:DUF6520 family protein [Ulvibacter litoralis]GHC64971.1 hypothetical protein GCM10008083_32830 [Ulvibacter litoralis]SDF23501.1 hypothetical protein SAMN05421855_1124 [Ulvibacter litoralis]